MDIEKKLLALKLKGYHFIWYPGSNSAIEYCGWFVCDRYPEMSTEDWRLFGTTKTSISSIEEAKADSIKKLEAYLGY